MVISNEILFKKNDQIFKIEIWQIVWRFVINFQGVFIEVCGMKDGEKVTDCNIVRKILFCAC